MCQAQEFIFRHSFKEAINLDKIESQEWNALTQRTMREPSSLNACSGKHFISTQVRAVHLKTAVQRTVMERVQQCNLE